MKKRMCFECEEDKIPLVVSIMKSEFGIELEELKCRKNSRFSKPAGDGFGDKVWRVNYTANRIEASFARPCFQSRSLKIADFKWDHDAGIWYAENNEHYADVCRLLKLAQVDSVPAKG